MPNPGELLIFTVLATAAIELITVIFRFGLDIRATRDTATTVGVWTMGIRVHHGYIGAALLGVSFFTNGFPMTDFWVTVGGGSLFCSDMIHHFLVLWPITGSHEFDLTYD